MTTPIAAGQLDRRVGHKTLWFPRYINPVHEGWYQGDHGRMWYWDGDCWNKHGTITGIFGVVRGPNAWRGLMHNVEFSEGAPLYGAASAGTQGYASGGEE